MSLGPLEGFMLGFALVANVKEILLILANIAFWFSNDPVLSYPCLRGEIRAANRFVNVDVDVRFIDNFSGRQSAYSY